jgi:septal ring factor EnvC (AmiA/AmiB activator)
MMDWIYTYDWSWAYSAKMLITLGILVAWCVVALFLGSRIGRVEELRAHTTTMEDSIEAIQAAQGNQGIHPADELRQLREQLTKAEVGWDFASTSLKDAASDNERLREQMKAVEQTFGDLQGRPFSEAIAARQAAWRCEVDRLGITVSGLQHQLKQRDARLSAANATICRIGKHPSSCPKGVGIGYYVPPADAVCNCGFDAALEAEDGKETT